MYNYFDETGHIQNFPSENIIEPGTFAKKKRQLQKKKISREKRPKTSQIDDGNPLNPLPHISKNLPLNPTIKIKEILLFCAAKNTPQYEIIERKYQNLDHDDIVEIISLYCVHTRQISEDDRSSLVKFLTPEKVATVKNFITKAIKVN